MSSQKDDKTQAEQGITQAGQGITAATQMTGPESTQYQGSFDIGNLLKQIMQYQMGVGNMPSQYADPTQQYLQQTGQLGQAAYGQTLQNIQNPYANYQSALQPSLQLAQNQINENAQQRGILNSGIDIGNMGEAGVQLAVQNAQNMMQQYQQNLQNATGMAGNIQNTGQTNLANLSSLYGQQQALGQQAMGRQGAGAMDAASYYAAPYSAQLNNYYGSQGQLGSAIGAGAGLYGGAATGAMIGSVIPGIGTLAGSLAGGALGAYGGSQIGRAF